MHILYILDKISLTTENCSTVLHNLFLLDMFVFNQLVIKNDLIKKPTSFLFLMEGVQLPQNQLMVLEDRTFHWKVLSKLYVTANLIFQQTLTLFFQLHRSFRLSRSSLKYVQRFGQFSLRYFKFWKRIRLTIM